MHSKYCNEQKEKNELSHLRGLLLKCNHYEINFFNRMYQDITKLEFSKLDWCIFQIENTLEGRK